MRLEMHGVAEFERDMYRLVRRVREAQGEALTAASEDVGRAFQRTARRLSGDHANSYETEPPRTSGDRTTVRGGPTMVYSRKISLKYGDLEAAVREAGPGAVQDAVVDAYQRIVH